MCDGDVVVSLGQEDADGSLLCCGPATVHQTAHQLHQALCVAHEVSLREQLHQSGERRLAGRYAAAAAVGMLLRGQLSID